MKTIRELKIKDFSGYFFNILDVDPELFMVSNAKECTDGTMLYNLGYSDKTGVPHIVFNNIDCNFKKSGSFSFLIFCDNDKNENMISNYNKIIKKLEDEIFSCIDEFEDEEFVFGGNFPRFKFRTDDNLVYNEKINIPVCVILLSSVIKKEFIHCLVFKLQRCLYESKIFFKKRWITLLIIEKIEMSY